MPYIKSATHAKVTVSASTRLVEPRTSNRRGYLAVSNPSSNDVWITQDTAGALGEGIFVAPKSVVSLNFYNGSVWAIASGSTDVGVEEGLLDRLRGENEVFQSSSSSSSSNSSSSSLNSSSSSSGSSASSASTNSS